MNPALPGMPEPFASLWKTLPIPGEFDNMDALDQARWKDVMIACFNAGIAEGAALAERLKLEAQIHAQEARTANATIAEIYQLISGATGEPGNWNGAEPVRKFIETLQAEGGKDAALAAFDAAVAIELPCVSTVEYNSHEICDWFAKNVRERLASPTPPAAMPNKDQK